MFQCCDVLRYNVHVAACYVTITSTHTYIDTACSMRRTTHHGKPHVAACYVMMCMSWHAMLQCAFRDMLCYDVHVVACYVTMCISWCAMLRWAFRDVLCYDVHVVTRYVTGCML